MAVRLIRSARGHCRSYIEQSRAACRSVEYDSTKQLHNYWQIRHCRRRQQQQQCQCRRCTFPYHLPNRRRSVPGRRILEDKRVLSIRRHPRTDAQSHRNIARLHASHRRTARPRSHYLPVSPRSQPVVHTAVVHTAHTARTTVSEQRERTTSPASPTFPVPLIANRHGLWHVRCNER